MEMIILTKKQADEVRGKHGKYSALEPIEIEGGWFMLPVEVLNDPEHKEVLDKLIKCEAAVLEETIIVDERLPEDDPVRVKSIYSLVSKTAMKEEWLPIAKK